MNKFLILLLLFCISCLTSYKRLPVTPNQEIPSKTPSKLVFSLNHSNPVFEPMLENTRKSLKTQLEKNSGFQSVELVPSFVTYKEKDFGKNKYFLEITSAPRPMESVKDFHLFLLSYIAGAFTFFTYPISMYSEEAYQYNLYNYNEKTSAYELVKSIDYGPDKAVYFGWTTMFFFSVKNMNEDDMNRTLVQNFFSNQNQTLSKENNGN